MAIDFSIVVPLHNEAGNLEALVDEIVPVMEALGQPWELICVNDGSSDDTGPILARLTPQHPQLIPVTLPRRSGQSAALVVGFKLARSEVLITLDGDGQNDPSDIPRLIETLRDCDLVCGYRVDRQDPWWRKGVSRVANGVRQRLCGDGVQDTCCALKAFRRPCLDKITWFDGMHRFLPALFHMAGFRIRELPVHHRPRIAGRSKYPCTRRLIRPLVDLCGIIWMRRRHLESARR